MPRIAACRLLLALVLALATSAPARADSVYLGGTYSGTMSMILDGTPVSEGGGSIGGSTGVVAGQSFAFLGLYCVDMFTGASLNTNYTATYNGSGVINGQTLPAAGQIAWLMLNIAPTLTTQAQFQAMQGLIWQLESPSGGHTMQFNTTPGSNSAAAIAYFNSYVAALGTNTAPTSSVWWINPVNAQGQYAYQGLVGITQSQRDTVPVPEPASAVLLAFGLAALIVQRKRVLF